MRYANAVDVSQYAPQNALPLSQRNNMINMSGTARLALLSLLMKLLSSPLTLLILSGYGYDMICCQSEPHSPSEYGKIKGLKDYLPVYLL